MVTGSDNTACESRPLAGWTAVSLACPGTLDLEIGKNRGITIEADDNILPLIETIVDDGRLVIRYKPGLRGVRPTRTIRFTAATPRIDAIVVSGMGDVRVPEIVGEDLALAVSGAGQITVASVGVRALDTNISGSGSVTVGGSSSEIDIRISGSGNLDAGDLTSQHAHVNISGSGRAIMQVERDIDGRISGSGSLIYTGQPAVDIRNSGSGRAVRMPG